ncbi:hypothetical protein [Streptomyces barkulensis]|uniref:hypothetical protein n=1 Tax=Streptomyces barkulensis TaxID=1257026 RepID=UPI000C6D2076|nr:hypothetical protein [Streptomyces barkulensis]
MTPNTWASAWQAALRTAVSDEATLLAGHNDLTAGGIAHLTITPGQVTAMATARHSKEEAHTVITLPSLTSEQVAAVRAASTHCGHHRKLRDGELPDCLADRAHTGNVQVAPVAAEIGFACTCGISPCRHAAALAHAVTRLLTTRPAEFATLRGLLPQPTRNEAAAPGADTAMTTTRTAPGGQIHVTAHHAWNWYREHAELPVLPDYAPSIPRSAETAARSWPPPPTPAPHADRLHALITDAATQARNHLLSGTALECAWDDDAIRLASTVPRVHLPEIADRLGLDIAQLRERLVSQMPADTPAL